MALEYFSIGLQNTDFPMLAEQQTRTVIGAQQGKAPSAIDTARLAYCHNVMPSRLGLDSVGYNLEVNAKLPNVVEGSLEQFFDIRAIYSTNRVRLYLGWLFSGAVFYLIPGTTDWTPVSNSPASGTLNFNSVTTGTVNGVTYIFYAGLGAYVYNNNANEFVATTLTGISIPDTLGLTASSGYLLAYTENAIAWSSTIDPTDFVPSEVTGAGGGNVAGLEGKILFGVANTLGILIYTEANVIAATYTGNQRYPFKFREVPEAKGGTSLDAIAYEANSVRQYVFTKAGLQALTSQRADSMLPQVTDFLGGGRIDFYNYTTGLIQTTDLPKGTTLRKKVKFVASRYLVMSYGIAQFDEAIIYDTALEKLGKLRFTHTDVIEYIGSQDEVSKHSIGLLLSSGAIVTVDTNHDNNNSSGIAVLGKLQPGHTRNMVLQGVAVENLYDTTGSLNVHSMASLDGKNQVKVAGKLTEDDGLLRQYKFRNTAKNHSIVLDGTFQAVTVLVSYNTAGRR